MSRRFRLGTTCSPAFAVGPSSWRSWIRSCPDSGGRRSSPGEGQTVGEGAVRARVARRTCGRWFTRVGLPSPRHFLSAARVLYAHRLLQDPGFTIEDVAKRLGYAQTKTLQLHARAYLGLT